MTARQFMLRWVLPTLGVGVGLALGVDLLAPWFHPLRPAAATVRRPPGVGDRRVVAVDVDQPTSLEALRAGLEAGASLAPMRIALAAMARRDPARALAIARELGRTAAERRELIEPLVQAWSRGNAGDAWHWAVAAGTDFDLPGRPPLAAVVVAEAARARPNAAAGLLLELLQTDANLHGLNVEEVADAAVAAMLQHGAITEAWAAIAVWARSAGADRLGREAIERAALATATDSPAEAARRLQELPPLAGRNFALTAVAAAWANGAPLAALEWAEQLPAGVERENATRAAFARWEQNDMVTASEWLVAKAGDPRYDPMIADVVADGRAVRANLPATLSLVQGISEPRLRGQALESVIRRWCEFDTPAALRFVTRDSKLTQAEKYRLLQALQPSSDDPES